MEKNFYARDLTPGLYLSEVFVVAEVRSGQAKNGPFYSLKLEDRSGQIEAKIWSPLAQELRELKPGGLIWVEGPVGSYREALQLTVERLQLLDGLPEGLDMGMFVASSEVAPEVIIKQLEEFLRKEISFKPWRKFCLKLLAKPEIKEKLCEAPGAKAMHHAYRGGLLEHTLAVCQLCSVIAGRYLWIDKSTLLAAAAFHDLGKAWELSAGLTRDYTDPGRLLGHIQLGLEILGPHLKKSQVPEELILHFKHILLSHHGEYEYGSPKRPKTAEAFVLHFADNLDAKLNMISQAFESGEAGPGAWSGYMRGLERQVFNPARPEEPAAPSFAAKPEPKPETPSSEQLCLLPLKE